MVPFVNSGVNLGIVRIAKESENIAEFSKKLHSTLVNSGFHSPVEGLENLVEATFYNPEKRIEIIAKCNTLVDSFLTNFVFRCAPYIAEKMGLEDKIYEAGDARAAVSGVVILTTLMIGALILTKIKGAALDAAANDTDAVNMINNIWSTGSTGMMILGLSVLVIGAIVILGYLMRM